MRRLLLTLALLLAWIAAAPALSFQWEEAAEILDGRCTLAPHLKIGLRRFSFRAPAAPSSDSRLSGTGREASETAPEETAAPCPAAPTRILIHRYNE